MKLGAVWNVFDGEELLEASIKSIRKCADFVVVVYQTRSNFGEKCSSQLEKVIIGLQKKKLADSVIHYEPNHHFSKEERRALISPFADGGGLFDEGIQKIGHQFFNELKKRDLGRIECANHGCTHIMSMDVDEFYNEEQLSYAKQIVEAGDYEGSACLMRYYYKKPTYECLPRDDLNHVPLILKLKPNSRYLLAHPYPCLVDPTRALSHVRRFKIFNRNQIEMHHMSMVRADITCKIRNVSNHSNYNNVDQFLNHFCQYTPDKPPVSQYSTSTFTSLISHIQDDILCT